MATFPTYVEVRFAGYGETFDPSVERTEMERGVPKQRLINSQVMQELAMTLQFKGPADLENFEDWYFDEIKRIGWFSMAHPRTGQTITARFKGGSIGTLTPLIPGFKLSTRDVVVEYIR